MAQTASIAAGKFVDFLSANDVGLSNAIGNLAQETSGVTQLLRPPAIVRQNAPPALAEKALATKYPAVHVYCDRIVNSLTEKFRTFSGKIRTVAEVRVSQDRIEGLEDQVRLYVDGVTQILDANRGSWGAGMFFTGGYEVKFDPIQNGGLNFIQIAKVTFEVDLSS
jgi:hypothetical protein